MHLPQPFFQVVLIYGDHALRHGVNNHMTRSRISEIFYSLQGEGTLTGLPMTFVRFAFCPWRCSWCDSVYTWAASDTRMGGLPVLDDAQRHQALKAAVGVEELSTSTIVERVLAYPSSWICITGGEPLSQPKGFKELVYALKDHSLSLEVETSGLIPLPEDDLFNTVDSWVVDVKTPSSGMQDYLQLGDLKRLRSSDQIKFVVQSVEDMEFASSVIEDTIDSEQGCQILISPVCETPFSNDGIGARETAEFIKSKLPMARLSLQLHKVIWGDQRGV